MTPTSPPKESRPDVRLVQARSGLERERGIGESWLSRSFGLVVTYEQRKCGLPARYTKRRVLSDDVTTAPFVTTAPLNV